MEFADQMEENNTMEMEQEEDVEDVSRPNFPALSAAALNVSLTFVSSIHSLLPILIYHINIERTS